MLNMNYNNNTNNNNQRDLISHNNINNNNHNNNNNNNKHLQHPIPRRRTIQHSTPGGANLINSNLIGSCHTHNNGLDNNTNPLTSHDSQQQSSQLVDLEIVLTNMQQKTNVIRDAIDVSKRQLSKFFTSLNEEFQVQLKEKDTVEQQLYELSNSLLHYQHLCADSIKRYYIIMYLLDPSTLTKFSNVEEYRQTLNKFQIQLQQLQIQRTQIEDDLQRESRCAGLAEQVIDQWDSARYYLCELDALYNYLLQKAPFGLMMMLHTEKMFEEDPLLAFKLGITPLDSLPTDNSTSNTPVVSSTNNSPSDDINNTNNTDNVRNNGSKSSQPQQPEDFLSSFRSPLQNNDFMPPQLTPEQIELCKLDTVEKRKAIVDMQQIQLNYLITQQQQLQNLLEQKQYERQQRIDQINALKQRIQEQENKNTSITTATTSNNNTKNSNTILTTNNTSSIANNTNPGTAITTTTNNNTLLPVTATNGTANNNPTTKTAPTNSQLTNPTDTNPTDNALSSITDVSTQQPAISTEDQKTLENLKLIKNKYKAINAMHSLQTGIDLDTTMLETQYYLTVHYRSVSFPNNVQTPHAVLLIYKVPPQPQLIQKEDGTTTSSIPDDAHDVFIIHDARLYVQNQDCTTKVRDLINECILTQSLQRLIIDIQTILFESSF